MFTHFIKKDDSSKQTQSNKPVKVAVISNLKKENSACRGGSRIFVRRGCTRLLLYFNTSKPHSFFFAEYQLYQSGGGGAHPLHPPPRSAPGLLNVTADNPWFACFRYFLRPRSAVTLVLSAPQLFCIAQLVIACILSPLQRPLFVLGRLGRKKKRERAGNIVHRALSIFFRLLL